MSKIFCNYRIAYLEGLMEDSTFSSEPEPIQFSDVLQICQTLNRRKPSVANYHVSVFDNLQPKGRCRDDAPFTNSGGDCQITITDSTGQQRQWITIEKNDIPHSKWIIDDERKTITIL